MKIVRKMECKSTSIQNNLTQQLKTQLTNQTNHKLISKKLLCQIMVMIMKQQNYSPLDLPTTH